MPRRSDQRLVVPRLKLRVMVLFFKIRTRKAQEHRPDICIVLLFQKSCTDFNVVTEKNKQMFKDSELQKYELCWKELKLLRPAAAPDTCCAELHLPTCRIGETEVDTCILSISRLRYIRRFRLPSLFSFKSIRRNMRFPLYSWAYCYHS